MMAQAKPGSWGAEIRNQMKGATPPPFGVFWLVVEAKPPPFRHGTFRNLCKKKRVRSFTNICLGKANLTWSLEMQGIPSPALFSHVPGCRSNELLQDLRRTAGRAGGRPLVARLGDLRHERCSSTAFSAHGFHGFHVSFSPRVPLKMKRRGNIRCMREHSLLSSSRT